MPNDENDSTNNSQTPGTQIPVSTEETVIMEQKESLPKTEEKECTDESTISKKESAYKNCPDKENVFVVDSSEANKTLADHSLESSHPNGATTDNKKVEDMETGGVKPKSCSSEVSDDQNRKVAFKAIFMGKKYDVELPVSSSVFDLKAYLSAVIDVPVNLQKIMIKGLAPDNKTLSELGVTRTTKVLVVGSKEVDIRSVKMSNQDVSKIKETSSPASAAKESLCEQARHKKIIDKGVPDDAHPGIKNCHEPIPLHPLSGMVNKVGDKVRLTFKLELDQVWIGTKQRTEKINMTSIRAVVSEPISGKEEYHIMALQLGPTEASRYWIYWVPAQYVEAIKDVVMGGPVWMP